MRIPELYMNGHSGCQLSTYKRDDGLWMVRKKSGINEYNERLRKQAKKQKDFNGYGIGAKICAPDVVADGCDESGLSYFDMPYVRGYKFSEYFSRISVSEIKNIYSNIEVYLDYLFESAVETKCSKKKVYEKVAEVKSKIDSNLYFDYRFVTAVGLFLEKNFPEEKLSVGVCHGDLTFSNIIFSDSDGFYLIDFLDSFIESPVIDLVKLRQDTKFGWSLLIDNCLPDYKRNRCFQVLNYLDCLIQRYNKKISEGDLVWYKYLEIFNLYRIMPYVKNARESSFLYKQINKVISI